jgi:hypothetical protein
LCGASDDEAFEIDGQRAGAGEERGLDRRGGGRHERSEDGSVERPSRSAERCGPALVDGEAIPLGIDDLAGDDQRARAELRREAAGEAEADESVDAVQERVVESDSSPFGNSAGTDGPKTGTLGDRRLGAEAGDGDDRHQSPWIGRVVLLSSRFR